MSNFESTGSPDQTIPAGAESPSSIEYIVNSKDPNIDLTDVLSAVFRVRHGNGQLEDLSADIDLGTQTTTYLKLTRLLDSDDFPEPDVVTFFPLLTFTGGRKVAAPSRTIQVQSRFTFRGDL